MSRFSIGKSLQMVLDKDILKPCVDMAFLFILDRKKKGDVMKKISLTVLVLLLLLTGCSSQGGSDAQTEKITIGVLVFAEHPALEATVQGLKDYLAENGLGEDKVELIIQNAQGDMGSADVIAKKYVADNVDLIYAVATNAAQAAYNATKGTDIPVIFNAVTDPVAAGLVVDWDNPQTNVSGVSDTAPIEKQVALIKEILPEATKIGILQNLSEVNTQVQIEIVKEVAEKYGLEIVVKGVSNSGEVATAAQQLASQVDAIYNLTDNLIVSSTATIVNQANKVGIPVFAAEDGQIDQGLLASDSISYYQLGRVAGQMVIDVLVNEEDIATMPVQMASETSLFVNEEVAEELGIKLPESVLNRMEE